MNHRSDCGITPNCSIELCDNGTWRLNLARNWGPVDLANIPNFNMHDPVRHMFNRTHDTELDSLAIDFLRKTQSNMLSIINYKTVAFSLALLAVAVLLLPGSRGTEDHEHAQALKDFVPDHPHLHDLVDKTGEGDTEAKIEFERGSLSARFAKVKENLPPGTDEAHVVLHFLDDYTHHVTGGKGDHSIMDLTPFLSLLEKEKEVRDKIVDLGKLVESGECDFTCLGDNLTKFMNESLEKIVAHIEL